MKKAFSIAVISCMVAFSCLFSSCKPEEEGDWIFTIELDAAGINSSAHQHFFLFIEPTMINVMKNDADRYSVGGQSLYFYGRESAALNRAKKSFKKAYKAIESNPEDVASLSGIKVDLYRYRLNFNPDEVSNSSAGEVIDSHTF